MGHGEDLSQSIYRAARTCGTDAEVDRLKIGHDMVKTLNIPMIGQDNSPEAVIREIRGSLQTFNEGTHIQIQCATVCFASELAVFMGRQNTEFQAYLTDWYDSPDYWKRTTKHQGTDEVSGLCFNLMGAMAPDWIPHIFTPESIGGGFTSRLTLVNETKKAKTIANPNKYPPSNGLRDELLHDLEAINRLTGSFSMSHSAERFYEEWYESEDKAMQKGDFPVPDPTFHTYCGRRGTLLRKLAMCATVSHSDELTIERDDIDWALEQMEDIEKRMPGTFAAVGRSHQAHQLAAVKRLLSSKGMMSRELLLRELHHDVSLDDMESVERTLNASGLIKVTRKTETNELFYKWLG